MNKDDRDELLIRLDERTDTILKDVDSLKAHSISMNDAKTLDVEAVSEHVNQMHRPILPKKTMTTMLWIAVAALTLIASVLGITLPGL